MKRLSWNYLIIRYPAFFPFVLLVISIIINLFLQPNMFSSDTLNGNMRVFLPLILVTVGQAIVLIGGGIDISVGGIVSIVNTLLATRVGLDGTPEKMIQFILISILVGLAAGAINGFFIAYLRLQPIITTYATSFLYGGLALLILPNPGGGIPGSMAEIYRSTTPLGIPLAFYVIAVIIAGWIFMSSTRFGKYLFAVGGKMDAAYETAVPVTTIQFSIYVISGLMSALAGLTVTLLSGSGNAEIGSAITLNSITAAVIGGNALSGGLGGVAGPVMGAITLNLIQNINSFAHINTWWETLAKALIIVVALATHGIVKLLQRRKA